MPENAVGFHWSMHLESLEFLFRADAVAIRNSERFKVGDLDIEFTSGVGSSVEWQRSETCGSLWH